MKNKLLIAIAIVTALSATALGQAAEIAKVNALVKSIDAVVKKQKKAELVFADAADPESTKEDWRVFKSEDDLEKQREAAETYSIAYCWKMSGKLAAVNFTFFSPSGDWTNYVYSYYRPDGTLAKASLDYRTFMGDIILEQDLYFNAKGKLIKRTQRVLDLSTHKPKKLTREVREQVASMAKEEDYYKSTSRLPFIKLVK